jgi:hypothetical protein
MSLDKGGMGTLDKAYTPKAVGANYIVDLTNSTHNLVYDKSGQLLADYSTPAAAMQAALNLLPSGGKIVVIGIGDLGTANLTYNASNLIIEGLGPGLSGFIYNGTTGTAFAIRPADTTTARNRIIIRDLGISSSTLHVNGIDLTTVSFGKVEDCYIGNSAGGVGGDYGINIAPGSSASAWFNEIVNCDIQGFYNGVYINGGNINTVLGGRVKGNTIGVNVDTGTNNVCIDVDYEGNTYGWRCGLATRNVIIGGYFQTNATADINLANAGAIVDAFALPTGLVIAYTAGAKLRFAYPYGVNMGTATGTGAQQNIAHGLGQIPTHVTLSEYNTAPPCAAYESAAADLTNLKVTATNAKTFRWKAEVL